MTGLPSPFDRFSGKQWAALGGALVAVLVLVVAVVTMGGDDDGDTTATPPTETRVAAGATSTLTPEALEATATRADTPESEDTTAPSDTPEPADTTTPSTTPVPSETPAPTITSTPTTSPTPTPLPCEKRIEWLVYSAQAQDTMSNLARRVGLTVEELAAANCLSENALFTIGEILYVPLLPSGAPSSALQRDDQPLLMLIDGDLWAWAEGGQQMRQMSVWGYNERPVMARTGMQVAYIVWDDTTAVDAVERGQALRGVAPGNVRIWLFETGQSSPVSGQPGGAAFRSPVAADKAAVRSVPAWSPDSTEIAWMELLLPEYTQQLVVFSPERGGSDVLVSNLPVSGISPSVIAMTGIQWGQTGIAVSGSVWPQEVPAAAQHVQIYDREGALLADVAVGLSDDDPMVAFYWVDVVEGDTLTEQLGILYRSGRWQLYDPASDALGPAPVAPELYNPTLPETSVYATLTADPQGGWRWTVRDPAQVAPQVIDFAGAVPQITISPDGGAVAWMDDAVIVWRAGEQALVPGTTQLGLARPGVIGSAGEPGLVWGPTGWRVRLDADVGDEPADACGDLAPRLVVGGEGRVMARQGVTLYSQPRTDPALAVEGGSIPSGEVFSVRAGSQCLEGARWWWVGYGDVSGWLAEGSSGVFAVEPVAEADCALPALLEVGTSAVLSYGPPIALRDAPGGDAAMISQIPGGSVVMVSDGPECADGVHWWQVNFGGLFGWMAEGAQGDYWMSTAECPQGLVSRLAPNMAARVVPGHDAEFRSLPGTFGGSLVLLDVPSGTAFMINKGPECGPGGFMWWEVSYQGLLGWMVESDAETYLLEPFEG